MPQDLDTPASDQVADLVHLIATAQISLDTLTPEQRALVETAVTFDDLKDEMAARVARDGLTWPDLTSQWLAEGSRPPKTVQAYQGALNKYNAWCARERLDPLRVTRPQADSFINALMMDGKSSDTTVRTTAWWIGSLYEWIRRHYGLANPFRGTRAAPKERKGEVLEVPSPVAVIRIIEALEPLEGLVVAFLSCTGVPSGALPEVSFEGKNFTLVFKGRVIAGPTPQLVATLLKKIPRENRAKPFAHRSATQWSNHIWKLLDRRSKTSRRRPEALISRGYSLRDFQYFWVAQNWPLSRDVVFFRDRLCLSSVTKVELLLKKLGLK